MQRATNRKDNRRTSNDLAWRVGGQKMQWIEMVWKDAKT
jgi:hypothetical protein